MMSDSCTIGHHLEKKFYFVVVNRVKLIRENTPAVQLSKNINVGGTFWLVSIYGVYNSPLSSCLEIRNSVIDDTGCFPFEFPSVEWGIL